MARGRRTGGRLKGTRNAAHVPLIERCQRHIEPEPTSGCWLWLGSISRAGYGRIGVMVDGGKHGWVTRQAHRVVYELYRGPIPAGLELDHLCRTPTCVNPDHLDPTTHKVNMHRSPHGGHALRPNRLKATCKNGHELAGANLVFRASGSRFCRRCAADAALASYHRRKNNLPGLETVNG